MQPESTSPGHELPAAQVRDAHAALRAVEAEVRKAVVGQQQLVDRLLVGLLARGHVLIEGVPGLAKTLTVKSLARSLALDFQRVQFTPDLLPADLIGTLVYDAARGVFEAHRGPVFTQVLLADEINRAPAKVQSALLEAMEERQVTLGGVTHTLASPFLVLATQNPIEQEGTYPLAEAQVDRFLLKVIVGYPSRSEEETLFERQLVDRPLQIEARLDGPALLGLQEVADAVYLDDRLRGYILDLVAATRDPGASGCAELSDLIAFGASPRATLYLGRAAKAVALLDGRGYVLPEDVQEIAPDVLRHRLILTYEAEAEDVDADTLVQRLLEHIEVP